MSPQPDETTAATATAPGEPSPESTSDMPFRDPQDLDPGEPETIKPEDVDHDFDAPGKSRDDIYKHAQELRTEEVGPEVEELPPEQQKQVLAMEQMAQGIDPAEAEAEALAKRMEAEAAGETIEGDVPAVQSTDPGVDTDGETVTLTIYGQQVDVTSQQIEEAGGKVALQKQLGAAMKFSRLSTYEANLRELDQRLAEREQMLSQGLDQNGQPLAPPSTVTEPTQPPAGAGGEVTDEEIDALTKEFSDGIFSGTQEEADGKIRSVISKVMRGRGQAATPTKEELVGETVAELRRLNLLSTPDDPGETARLNANAMFREEYKEFQEDTDPIAFRTVQAEIQEVRRSPVMAGRPLPEVVRMAADRVRKRFAGQPVESLDFRMDTEEARSAETTGERLVTGSIPGRLTLKKRTVMPPTQAGQRNEPPPEKSSKQSNSAYVNQMRQNRGQAGTG